AGISADMSFSGRGLKGAMKSAERAGARFALVLGKQELENGVVAVKDLAAHEQSDVAIDVLVEHLRGQLN
ncbi:MAG: His/Gly/Thr/Pro-type tRNA ligase C-terminal domain-containing protein, partial [Corynebacterium striatum]|nr:His/Gly/Thr/Pro-type tRNA ligase C-terminal domain-containing protein [Corynebacterium striatum]